MHLWISAANLWSAIGIGGCPFQMCRISKRASEIVGRIGHERENISRHSDKNYSRHGRIEESSGIARWRILCTKIERKSWHDTEAHFTDTRFAREGELHEWFRIISGYRNDLEWNIFSRSQSSSSRSKFWWDAEPPPKSATWCMEFLQHRETFLAIHVLCSIQCRCLQEGRQPWTFFYQLKFHRWTAKTTDNGTSVWWIPHTIIIFVLEDNIQNTGEFLFRFFLGKLCFGSKKCRLSIRWTILNLRAEFRVVLISRSLRCWMRRLRLLWTRSSRVPASRRRSVWRNRKLRKKIGSFEEDRSLRWSRTTSGQLAIMIPFFITLIYSLLLFATMMFGNSTRGGMKFHCQWPRSHLMTSWNVCTNWEYVSLINSTPY